MCCGAPCPRNPTVEPRAGEQGLLCPRSRGVCEARALGLDTAELCSFCSSSRGVCLQSVWLLDSQRFHMAE